MILKVYSSWEKVEPWCSDCIDWRIQEKGSSFWYTTKICHCVNEAKEINEVIQELKDAGIDIGLIEHFSLAWYTDWMFSIAETEWLMNKDWWIYAHWEPWTWKSYCGFIGMYLAITSGYTVQYANVPKMLDALRPNEARNEFLIQELCDVDFLLLDDLWQEKLSPWVLERLYIIINERYIRDRKTYITWNCSLDELANKLWHKAIISRIRWKSTPVYFFWKDKR